MKHKHKHWKYRNIVLTLVGIFFGIWLANTQTLEDTLDSLNQFQHVGAFMSGFLLVSTFTAATGTAILLSLNKNMGILELGLLASLGATFGNLIVLRLARNALSKEVDTLFETFGGNHLKHLFHTKYFSWSLPLIGALIVASPLPDELGITLLGLTKMKMKDLIILSFFLHTTGIFLLLLAAKAFVN
jgi:uncharacterized membrane protein YdjX (TVP38/TMEM64 family)